MGSAFCYIYNKIELYIQHKRLRMINKKTKGVEA